MLAVRNLPLGPEPVSHEFPAGAVTVVLGRNRSGKTRLCRLIAGLEANAPGVVEIDGEDVSRRPPGERSVALVYQAFVNYPNLSVFDNIASPLKAAGAAAGVIVDRVTRIAAQLQLDDLLDRRPDQLSGGQQQRLAIGRALAKSARVLVMDEPLVNLDYKLREALEFELRGMLHEENLTVVYTTSDPRDAFNLGDAVVLLDDHRIVQAGAPLEVYERPVSAAAAELMSDPGVNRLVEGSTLWVVRPEQLTLEAPPVATRRFELEVLSVETNGSETFLHGSLAGRVDPSSRHWVAKLVGLHRIAPGERVTLHAPEQAVLSFGGAAGG